MVEFKINVTVSCPDITLAADTLAAAILHQTTVIKNTAPVSPAPVTAAPAQIPAPAPVNPAQAMPVATTAQAAPPATASSAPTAMPVNAPTGQPPVAPAPTYTYEQVGKAGADLVAANQGMMPTLMALLQRYGVQLVTDLKPEQLGPFATELRGLGAKI